MQKPFLNRRGILGFSRLSSNIFIAAAAVLAIGLLSFFGLRASLVHAAPPAVVSFTAAPTLIAPAGTSTLSWNVTGANSITINPGAISTTTLVGSIAVHPTVTTLYTLVATKGAQHDTATTTVSVATAPTAPGSFALTNIVTSTADLSWTASTPNNGATISFYNIYRGTSLSVMPRVGTTTGLTYHDTGLATSTLYYWYADAVDSVGNMSPLSDTASGTTQSGITPTISSFIATPNIVASAGTSTLSWNVLDATSLTINPGSITTTTLAGSLEVHPTVTTDYTLSATNVYGTTVETSTVTVDDLPPSIPSGLVAVPFSTNEIDIAWDPSTDDHSVAGYDIYRDGSLVSTATSLFFYDTGLSVSTLHTYNVAAFDAVGNASALSSSVTTTTLATSPASGTSSLVHFISSGGWRGAPIVSSPSAPPVSSAPSVQSTIITNPSLLQFVQSLKTIIFHAASLGISLPSSTLHFAGLSPRQTSSTEPFARNLGLHSAGPDVEQLQQFLIAERVGPAAERLAVSGTTRYFGQLTQNALIEFQLRVGISPATGYFGPVTRAYVNTVL